MALENDLDELTEDFAHARTLQAILINIAHKYPEKKPQVHDLQTLLVLVMKVMTTTYDERDQALEELEVFLR